MKYAPVYIFLRVFYRFIEFWKWWYVRIFLSAARSTLYLLERLDRGFAVKINFYHILQPLYQDYSIVGRIIGPFFRIIRVIIGVLIYATIITVVAVLYLVWAMIPFFIIFKAFS